MKIFKFNVFFYLLKVLKVWDIREYVCIQSIAWKYPTSKLPDHSSCAMYLTPLGGSSSSLILSCNNFLAEFKLQAVGKQKCHTVTSHNKPIISVVYNESVGQVRQWPRPTPHMKKFSVHAVVDVYYRIALCHCNDCMYGI